MSERVPILTHVQFESAFQSNLNLKIPPSVTELFRLKEARWKVAETNRGILASTADPDPNASFNDPINPHQPHATIHIAHDGSIGMAGIGASWQEESVSHLIVAEYDHHAHLKQSGMSFGQHSYQLL